MTATPDQVIPRAEYASIPVFVQGRGVPPGEIVIHELMAGDIADTTDDLFAILGALTAQMKEQKLTSLAGLTVDTQRLLVIKPVREAFFNIASRAANISVATLRQLDAKSLLAVITATVNSNQVFFSMLPGLLGLTSTAAKSRLQPLSEAEGLSQ